MKHILALLVGTIALTACASVALAQAEKDPFEQNLRVEVSPRLPRAGESVFIVIESFSTNLNKATIEWRRNGAREARGIGLKTFSFTNGALGTATTIAIRITTAESRLIEKTLTFRPAHVDLILEAKSYRPPFYRGKSLLPYQGAATVTAVPTFIGSGGARIAAKNLIYKWEVDGDAVGDASGYGRQQFHTEAGALSDDSVVGVRVSTLDGTMQAEGEALLTPTQPKIVLYEDHPLYGILFGNALAEPFSLSGEEIRVVAVPYFFSVPSRLSALLEYDWAQNGMSVRQGGDNALTLRVPEEGEGVASVSVRAQHAVKILQGADAAAAIAFGEEERGGGVFDFLR